MRTISGSRAKLEQRLQEAMTESHKLAEQVLEIAAALEGVDEDVDVLEDAVLSQDVVSFEYRKPSAFAAERRILSPYAVEGDGYDATVLGYDHERDDIRRFRLDRIVSTIALEPQVRFRTGE